MDHVRKIHSEWHEYKCPKGLGKLCYSQKVVLLLSLVKHLEIHVCILTAFSSLIITLLQRTLTRVESALQASFSLLMPQNTWLCSQALDYCYSEICLERKLPKIQNSSARIILKFQEPTLRLNFFSLCWLPTIFCTKKQDLLSCFGSQFPALST